MNQNISITFLERENPAEFDIFDGPVTVRRATRREARRFARSQIRHLEELVQQAEETGRIGERDADAVVAGRN